MRGVRSIRIRRVTSAVRLKHASDPMCTHGADVLDRRARWAESHGGGLRLSSPKSLPTKRADESRNGLGPEGHDAGDGGGEGRKGDQNDK
eukprot:6230055-Pyramimonas_sp.AAC.1